jgi:thiol-disulfide isomerase/thioredoxin
MIRLLKLTVILYAFPLFSQTYFSENFESGNLDQWTTVDFDGDGYTWAINNYGDEQNNIVISQSWTNGVILYPDNWLISIPIDLSSAVSPTLFWKVKAQDQAWANENYTVYVADSDDISSLESSPFTFNEVIGTSNGYVNRTLDLSDFVGQESVHIAFRHHDVSDMFVLNVDEISIVNSSGDAVSLSSPEKLMFSENGSYIDKIYGVVTSPNAQASFDFSVTSFSSEPFSNYSFESSIDGSSSTYNSSQTLNQLDSESFTVNLGLGEHQVSVSLINSSGDVLSTISETITVSEPTPNYVKNDSYGNNHNLHSYIQNGDVVVLDLMASYCGPCETSTPHLQNLYESYGEGQNGLHIMGITSYYADNTNAIMNSLGWGGYYPYFAYEDKNWNLLTHYESFTDVGGLPSFMVICPNRSNPSFSTVSYTSVGWPVDPAATYAIDEIEDAVLSCSNSSINLSAEKIVSELDYNIYPNPASNFVNIEFENNSSESTAKVQVINILGEIVLDTPLNINSNFNSIRLPIFNLNNGTYQINLTVGSNFHTKTINVFN